MPRHCATCSRSESDATFYGSFCEFCSRNRLLEGLPGFIEMKVCRRCGRIWTGFAFSEPSKRSVEEAVRLKLKGYSIRMLEYTGDKVKLDIGEQRREGLLVAEKEFNVRPNKVTCDECYKRMGGYWEALIQLRGSETRVRAAEAKIQRYISRTQAFISKVEEATNGTDVYISDKRVATAMCSFLHLKPVTTYTLYGLKQGKRVYRNTYAIHL
ncbi:MAG: 60S ribosomal export protein NMD3 [Candidatus Marsarchaeota archaeon]|jgi:NMD protein affecting ribosome stability and mRNA decay|nr:60S ribosomal export protein NMD3 [Candidatus Marsarchaeota archaeon]